MVASFGPSRSSRPYRPLDFGCGRPNRLSNDYPHDDYNFGCGSRDSGAVAMVLRFALIAAQNNYTVDCCSDLYGRPVAYQAVVISEADIVTNSANKYLSY